MLTGLIALTSAAEPAPEDLASSSATPQEPPKPSGPGHEVLAALSRAGATFLAVMFQRPIRLFRPVKISTWAGLQAVAEEQVGRNPRVSAFADAGTKLISTSCFVGQGRQCGLRAGTDEARRRKPTKSGCEGAATRHRPC